jgi:FKBP-type peptidyl-prolyl cis-trans isomerase FkpA
MTSVSRPFILSNLRGATAACAFLLLTLSSAPSLAKGAPETDDEKAFYSIGTGMAQQFSNLQPIGNAEIDMLVLGLRDALDGKPLAVDQQQGSALVRSMVETRQTRAIGLEKQAAGAFLEAEAAKAGAERTESGLIYTVIEAGSGASPSATDKVKVHYHGTLRDGTVFDSSVERNSPAEFPLNRVIPCWTEGVAKMKVGGKSRLVCPAEIAYGDRSTGRIPGGAALSFDVELIEILP